MLLALLALLSSAAPDIAAGKALFEQQWVASSSAHPANEGLGPFYDSRSCSACHVGAGPGPVSSSMGSGLLLRLGNPGGGGDPVYGAQLQTQALPGLKPEAAVTIVWNILDDRRMASLHISDFGYGPLDPHTFMAVRRAPSLRGAARLEAVSDAEILAGVARERREGMEGRAAVLGVRLGRWGWKAENADLSAQIAVALQNDMGLSSSPHPDPWGECTPAETACRDLAVKNEGARIEVPDSLRAQLLAYVSSLPSPAGPHDRSTGYAVFRRIGCGACHTPLTTPNGKRVNAMTDLLLHDMGPELGDGIAEGVAKPSEWRTAPLWNLSDELAAGGLLHDGRARDIAEAVRWHGGQASKARKRFSALSVAEQTALEDFLLEKK
jgi:CxxC motif-containing protein (DUF1111 family)